MLLSVTWRASQAIKYRVPVSRQFDICILQFELAGAARLDIARKCGKCPSFIGISHKSGQRWPGLGLTSRSTMPSQPRMVRTIP
jgi:hypothetical protein